MSSIKSIPHFSKGTCAKMDLRGIALLGRFTNTFARITTFSISISI